MLSEALFIAWAHRLGLSAEAVQEVRLIRTTPPNRRVRSRAGNVVARFPSGKMGRVIQAESHTVELPFVYAAEQDPAVLELWDQPRQGWRMPLQYVAKSGRAVVAHHTPDYFVLRQDSAGWVECKPQERLVALAAEQPNRYRLGDAGHWRCPPGEVYASALGLTYRVFSSVEINWIQQRNWTFLADYLADSCPPVTAQALARVLAALEENPGLPLALLRQQLAGVVTADEVHGLIASGRIYVDLAADLLTEPRTVRVFRDATAAVVGVLAPPELATLGAAALAAVEEGQGVRWDDRPWTIGPVTPTHTTLVSEQGDAVQLRNTVLAAYQREGRLIRRDLPVVPGLTEEGRALFAQASLADQATANHRYALLRPYLEDGVSLDACGGKVPRSTKFSWAKRWRDAAQRYGHGYLGLLDRQSGAERGQRAISNEVKALLHQALDAHYATSRQQRKRRAYGAFLLACQAAGLPEVSERTFYREAGRYLTAYDERLRRAGPRAARAVQPPAESSTVLTPRHGELPWALAHLDHTEVDLELVSSRTGRPLGRPWATLLIDAFTRRVLALYVTYAKPSYVSCMMALRLCVQRWGRLPAALVVDGGPEFHSTTFETLLAWYRVTVKTRPPSEPTYGSVAERLFGTANSTFLHTLLGNTQVMQRVRQVTAAVDPKRQAQWTLGDLYTWLGAWAYEVYDTLEHPALSQSPRQAHARADEQSGARAHVRIAYDQDFLMRTLPTTHKGTAKVQPGRGIKVHNLRYWCGAFDDAEVEGTSVAVRYDPFDVGTAYAYLPKSRRWVECHCDYYALLHGRSERELLLMAAELRKAQRDHAARYEITAKQLAAFSARADAHEELLRQRERDAETRAVLAVIRGEERVTVAPQPASASDGPTTPASSVIVTRAPKVLPRLR